MPDETFDATQSIGLTDPGSHPRVEFAAAATGDPPAPGSATADCGSATAGDERPLAFQATEAIDSARTNGSMDATGAFDATAPQGMETAAGFVPDSQGNAFPTGAFDPTGMATGNYDATDPGNASAGPAGNERLTQAETGAP